MAGESFGHYHEVAGGSCGGHIRRVLLRVRREGVVIVALHGQKLYHRPLGKWLHDNRHLLVDC